MRPSPFAQPCERLWLDIQVGQDLTKEASTDCFSFVNGNNCRATVLVLPESVAALLPDPPKSKASQNGL
jgi:hypothetical protein